jgi:hypothetical protein
LRLLGTNAGREVNCDYIKPPVERQTPFGLGRDLHDPFSATTGFSSVPTSSISMRITLKPNKMKVIVKAQVDPIVFQCNLVFGDLEVL